LYTREKRYLHKSGSVVWANVVSTVVRDPEGKPLHMVTQIQDVTERRRSDELAEQLRQAQKMEAVGRLAGGIAHDFNNLLTAIGRYGQFAAERTTDEELGKEIAEIRRAADRASELTRQLLAFSRQQTLTPSRVDVNAIVDEVISMLRRLVGEHIPIV